jgi:TolB protein
MTKQPHWNLLVVAVVLTGATIAARQQPPAQQPAPQQPSELSVVITGGGGSIPHYAVPDFVALNPEAADLAKTLAQVLRADLSYEREVDVIASDIYSSIPVARAAEQIPFDSWRELNADAVVFGTVQKTGKDVRVQVRLYNVRTRQQALGSEYTGTDQFPRNFAHSAADDIHKQQRNLRGVARTKLAFISDRERQRVRGTGQQNRESKEVWISDYDGANQRRVTLGNELNAGPPSWSPDARAVAYSSWRKVATGGAIDIYISRIFQGMLENPTKGRSETNMQPVFSPDGTRIAFTSNRYDNNLEIYVMNVDGSGLRRLTNHPAADAVPTWAPNGAQIAFTSDRSGTAQIYVMSATDGSNLRKISSETTAESASWSPTGGQIAFAARTGAGYDVKVFDLSTGETRPLTYGEGSNESPAYSPNGRHLAFMSTRKGGSQIYTMTLDGRDVRQITTTGNNVTPSWSN